MSVFFYYDNNGRKFGPVTLAQVKDLAMSGVIVRNTPMETEVGQKGYAEQLPGVFVQAPLNANNVLLEQGEQLLVRIQAFKENEDKIYKKAIFAIAWKLSFIYCVLGFFMAMSLIGLIPLLLITCYFMDKEDNDLMGVGCVTSCILFGIFCAIFLWAGDGTKNVTLIIMLIIGILCGLIMAGSHAANITPKYR